ncbi:hypothetical protein FISHEDRAFT_77176 [Fistulina hepatica ATCC 64428]|uniref:Uncharacterized protein n=1 Tax=Fistulina hepatica ATCC 64428 TaxID=1128425 RepID=A0A0D7A4D7_9AGAR|nr:hypothetical protein FISHEDRAFT_77176 [Fistulina hepatica ATCC 64428]
MAATPSQNEPWPRQTQHPAVPDADVADIHHADHGLRRKRKRLVDYSDVHSHASSSLYPRDTIYQETLVEEAMQDCIDVGNNVYSCYPTSDTTFPQHDYASFVWNSRSPVFTQTDLVNIYLFNGDTLDELLAWYNVTNPTGTAGLLRTQVNDTWWGTSGDLWDGTNLTYPYYFIITRNDATLDGTQSTLSMFSAVQTTYADSVLSSMESTSAAAAASRSSASAASAASASSASAAAASLTATPSTTSGSTSDTGSVQSSSSTNGFPDWAIAVIVILGFFALAASCILVFLILRRARRREYNRNSMGSSDPMMAHADLGGNEAVSPIVAAAAAGAGADAIVGGRAATSSEHDRAGAGSVAHDGDSSLSRSGSAAEGGLFSGADAAIIADAFRKTLRKWDMASPAEEGESPDSAKAPEQEILSQELAEEGRDIRSVGSSRGVRVETSGDTATDEAH